LRNFII